MCDSWNGICEQKYCTLYLAIHLNVRTFVQKNKLIIDTHASDIRKRFKYVFNKRSSCTPLWARLGTNTSTCFNLCQPTGIFQVWHTSSSLGYLGSKLYCGHLGLQILFPHANIQLFVRSCWYYQPGRRVKLNRSQAVNFHKLVTSGLSTPSCKMFTSLIDWL